MSVITNTLTELDIREQIVRIDRSIDEAAKFRAETAKLTEEAAKLQRERTVAPWLATGAVAGGWLTPATLLMRALGVL